ncbi:MAG: PQQ-binding-like beta-propeller repeat protein [Novosphingobium sp.]|nr:PQQ-binding-like beta-propeller repeat protein [Novosphingobium sp.]MCP5401581.1 PQQ-binding-like beta-propeller repeat protein [Novosphingobium sp.]
MSRNVAKPLMLAAAGSALAFTAANAEAPSAPVRPAPVGFTADQVSAGRSLYATACAACHGPALQGGAAPSLKGRTFMGRWGTSSIGAMFRYIRDTMPPGNAGSLSSGEVTSLVTFILSANGIKSGDAAMPADYRALQGMHLPFTGDTSGGLARGVELPPWPESPNPAESMSPVTDALLQSPPEGDWLSWRRTLDGQGFSPLSQIDKANVGRLRLAWSYNLAAGPNASTPLVHDGVIFVYSNGDNVDALNAATGEVIWNYKRDLPQTNSLLPKRVKRNMALYGDRLYFGSSDNRLVALNARSGEEVWATPTGPTSGGPLAVRGMVIEGLFRGERMPPHPGDPLAAEAASAQESRTKCVTCGGFGRIVGVDPAGGKQRWNFNVVPQPGEPGTESWNDIPFDDRSGGSVWTSGYYDPALDLVFIGTGNTYNTAPLTRPVGKPGVTNDALYMDSTLALEPGTGELAWYYQHHARDLWDLDWVFERMIIDLPIDGKQTRSVVTVGKIGVLDALAAGDGKYLFSLDAGLQNVITHIDPETGRKTADDTLIPGDETVVICPPSQGAKNWIPGSYDPSSMLIYQPVTMACLQITPADPGERSPLSSGIRWSVMPRPGSDGRYGRIQIYDLKNRSTRWIAAQRAPMTSGVLATAGGLVFAGGLNRQFSAFDSANGDLLWSTRLGNVPSGAPISFAVDGKQYIAVVTGYGTMLSGSYLSLVPEIPVPAHSSSSIYVFELAE